MTRIMRVSLGRLTTTVLLCVGLVVAGCGQALAVTYTWTQFGNGTYSWSTTSNWNAGGAAVSGSTTTVTFGTGASGTLPNSFNTISNINNGGTTFTLTNLNFANTNGSTTTAGTMTLTGDSLTFTDNSGTAPSLDLGSGNTSPGTVRPFPFINNNIVLSTGSAAASGIGLQLAATSNNANLTINGTISGTGGFYKTGAGVVFLTATNSFTGDIFISRGNSTSGGVVISGSGRLGSTGTYAGNITVNSSSGSNGALTFNSAATQTLSGTIASTGTSGNGNALQMWGPGLLRLSGNNTYSGTTTITSGTLQLGSSTALGSSSQETTLKASSAGTVLDVGGQNVTAEPLTVTGSVSGASAYLVSNGGLTTGTWGGSVTHATGLLSLGKSGTGDLLVTGSFSGAGNVAMNAVGTYTLTNAAYTGTTGVTAGTLVFGAGSTMSSAGAINVASSGTLGLQASLTHDITGSGRISLLAGGTLSAASIGTNRLSLAGVSGTTAGFTSTSATTLAPASVTMSGYATITLASATSGLLSTGSVAISGLSNILNVGGVTSAGNTYSLLSGTGLTNTGSITLTGAAIANQTLAPGGSTTIGRTTYNFNQTSTALELAVTGTTYNLFWNGGVSGTWDYTTASWQQSGTGSNITFVQGDTATLGTASTITVDSGTYGSSVQAALLTVNNSSGTVALSGSAISTTGTFGKSGAGSFTMSNVATFGSGAWVRGGSMTTSGSGSMTVTSGGLNVSSGTLTANAATTVTAGGLNVSGGLATLNNASTIAGGITVTGGTAAFNAANTVSGAVAASGGGAISLGNLSGVGAGSISLDNGTLISTLASGTLANAVAVGAGGGTVSSSNPFTLSGNVTGTTSLTVSGSGEVVLSGTLSSSPTGMALNVLAGGSARVTGTSFFWNTTTSGTIDGTLTFDNGLRGGGGSFTKEGSGALVVTGSLGTSYMKVNAGTLRLTTPGTIMTSGTYGTNSSNVTPIPTMAFGQSGTYGLNTWYVATGVFTTDSGTALATFANSTMAGSANKTVTVDANTTVAVSGATDLLGASTSSRTLFVQGAGNVTFSGAVTGSSGSTSFSITKTGTAASQTGTLTLSSSNSYNGTTTVEAGTLMLGNAWSLGSTGTGAGTVVRASSVAGLVGTLDLNGQSVSGESLTLTGTNTNNTSGTGAYLVNSNTGTAASWAGSATVSGGLVGVGGSGGISLSGTVDGAGSIVKIGSGLVTLSAANTFNNLTVGSGTLRLTNSQASGTGSLTVNSGAALSVLAALGKDVANSGTVAIGPSGSLTAASIGTGAVSLSGVSGTTASFTSTSATTLAPASVTMSGYATITLASATSGLLSTGPVSISGLGNVLSLGGATTVGSTYSLLSGTGLTNTGSITLTGAAISNQTLAPGDSTTIGRTTYNFNQTATALELAVTGTTYNLFWNGGPSGTWDYTTANWQKDGAGTNIVFVQGDTATLGTASTITVDSGTFDSSVQAASLTVNNSAGTVALSGSAISTTGTFGKSGAGSLTMSNVATFGSGAWVGAGSMTTSGSMTVTSGGLNVSGGSLAANAATTITAGGLNVSGGSATLNNASSITGNITLTGGTTALNAANTVSGTVGLSGGAVLSLGNASGAGAGTLSISNGTLASSMSSGTLTNPIAVGSGSATINNVNALSLTGSITGIGNTLVKSGSGTLTISILSTSGTGDGMVVNTSGGTTVFSGTAMKNFGSTSTFNGPVTLDNASIQLSNNASLAGTGTITTLGITSIDVKPSGAGSTKTITAPVSFGSGTASLNSVSNRNLELSGVISGSGNVTTTGIAAVRFTGTTQGTFSGTLTASSTGAAGTTQVTTQALGTGALVTNPNPSFTYTGTAAPLLFKNTVLGEYSGTISGSGVVGSYAIQGSRAILSGSNTYTGGTYLWNNIGFKNSSAFGTGTITAMDSSSRINNDAATTLTIANPISITSGMVMAFTGSSVTGLTGTITGGTDTYLRASTGGTIDLTQQSTATMNTFSGVADIGGSGATMWTTGDANFGNASAIAFSGSPQGVVNGTTTNQVSVLVAKAANVSISKPMLIGASSTSTYATFDTGTNAMTISGGIANRVADYNTTGGVIKIGSGLLTLSGTNTYSDSTTILGGVLQFAKQASLYGGTSANWTAANITTGSGATLALNVGGASEFTANDVTTIVALGTGTSGFQNGSTIGFDTTNASGGTFAYSGSIANTNGGSNIVGLLKKGTGSLTLSGNNTYTGPTTVNVGGLVLNGSLAVGSNLSVAAAAWLGGTGTAAGVVTMSGTLSPGNSPGVITLGSLVLTSTSVTAIEVASAGTRGTAYDGVSILDASGLTYGGTMAFAFGGSAIADNTTLDIFSFSGSAAGDFASLVSTGFYAGTWTNNNDGTFTIAKDSQTLTFRESTGDVIVVPEPGTALLGVIGALAALASRRGMRRRSFV